MINTNRDGTRPHFAGRKHHRLTRARRLLVIGTLLGATCGGATVVATTATGRTPSTPNQCIQLNHGDWNGCNVGNSGRGDLPYRTVR